MQISWIPKTAKPLHLKRAGNPVPCSGMLASLKFSPPPPTSSSMGSHHNSLPQESVTKETFICTRRTGFSQFNCKPHAWDQAKETLHSLQIHVKGTDSTHIVGGEGISITNKITLERWQGLFINKPFTPFKSKQYPSEELTLKFKCSPLCSPTLLS